MEFKEAHYILLGTYRLEGDLTMLPVEGVIDIKRNYPNYIFSGFWHHHDGSPKHQIELETITTEDIFFHTAVVRYSGNIFEGSIYAYRDPALGMFRSKSGDQQLSLCLLETKNGYMFNGIFVGETKASFSVEAFEHDPTQARENVVSLRNDA